jgi:hypothetical protein
MRVRPWAGVAVAGIFIAGCGGGTKTKTVVRTVTATTSTAQTSTASTSSTATTRAATPSGPPPCRQVTSRHDVKPKVCVTPAGSYLKIATDNHPISLKTLTLQFLGARTSPSVSTGSGGVSATANGTFLIVTLKVTNDSNTPQTVESIGGSTFQLSTLTTNSKSYSESFAAENQADQQSFVSQSTTPVQPGASQTGDVVFDLPGSGLATIRKTGASLLFGNFGSDLSTASASNNPSTAFGFMIIYHKDLQG